MVAIFMLKFALCTVVTGQEMLERGGANTGENGEGDGCMTHKQVS